MALYEITAPDGTVYEIEGPEGASKQQLVGAVLSQQRRAKREALDKRVQELRTPVAPPPPETTFMGGVSEFFKGIPAGAIGLVETAAVGASSVLPEETEKAAREGIASIAQGLKTPFKASEGYEDSTSRKFGEAVGSFIPMAAAIPFGPAGVAAAGGLGVSAGAGEARLRAEQEGATGDQRATATALGIIPGALEVFAPIRIFRRLDNEVINTGVDYVKRALMAGGEEAAQEAASGFAQNLIAKGVYKPEQELIEGLGEQAAYGGAVGGLAQGLLDLALGRRLKGGAPTPPTTPPTTPPPQLGFSPLAGTPIVFPDGSVALSSEQELQKRYGAEQIPPLQLGYGKTFTPVIMSDGSIITTPQELEEYRKTSEERAFQDKYTFKPEQVGLPESAEQAGLFYDLKEPAQKAQEPVADVGEPSGEFPTVLTEEVLQQTGLNKQSGFYKQLLNKDISVPEQGEAVGQTLKAIRANPNLAPNTKAAAERVAMNAFNALAKQQSIPGLRAPRTPTAPKVTEDGKGREQRSAVPDAATVPQGSGVSVPDTGKPGATVAPTIAAPQRGGLDIPAPVPSEPVRRAEEGDPAVKIEALKKMWESFNVNGKRPDAGTPERVQQNKVVRDIQMLQRQMALAPTPAAAPIPTATPTPTAAPIPTATTKPTTQALAAATQPTPTLAAPTPTAAPTPAPKAAPITPTPTAAPIPTPKTAPTPAPTPKTEPKAAAPVAPTPAPKEPKREAAPPPAPKTTDTTAKVTAPKPPQAPSVPKTTAVVVRETVEQELGKKPKITPAQKKARENYFTVANGDRDKALELLAADMYFGSAESFNPTSNAFDLVRFGKVNELMPNTQTGGRFGKDFYDSLNKPEKAIVDAKVLRYMEQEARGSNFLQSLKKRQDARAAFEQYLEDQSRTIEGEVREIKMPRNVVPLIKQQTEKLSGKEVKILEAHYKASSGSNKFINRVAADIATLVNKGADFVSETIRDIIEKMAKGVVAFGIVFNPMVQGNGFNFDVEAAVARAQEAPAITVPAEAAPKMSDLAKSVYVQLAESSAVSGKGFIIADKPNGMIHAFSADGKLIAQDTALYGKDIGDVEEGNSLKGGKKITPAGKFTLKAMQDSNYVGGWRLDLAETSTGGGVIAIHPAYLGDVKEKRLERLASADVKDNRISYGCINTSHQTFLQKFKPNLNQLDGGMVFVLPDSASLASEMVKPSKALIEEALLAGPLHPLAETALKDGDLKAALDIMGKVFPGTMGSVSEKLVSAIKDTKIKFKKGLKDASGREAAGEYDPKTDTITLNPDMVSPHVLLHEATHAATSHVLDNKSHPVTKQLEQLFNDVKASLDTAYGAESLDEFVAEAFSNPQFQQKLAAINPKGGKITALQRFANTVINFIRRIIGRDSKPVDSAYDTADRLISSILSPAPDSRSAGSLYSIAASPKNSLDFLNSIAERAKNFDPLTQNKIDGIHEFITGSLPGFAKNVILQSLPLNALVDVAEKYAPKARRLGDLIDAKSGKENERSKQVEGLLKVVEDWAGKATPETMQRFNSVVYDSTLFQVDPTTDGEKYKNDKDRYAEYQRVKAEFNNKLDPEAQRAYVRMRDGYKSLYDQIIDVVKKTIDDATPSDPAKASKLKNDFLRRLSERGGLEPYFPLTRSGDYWLSYKSPDGEFHVEAFETKRARDRAMEEYKDAGAKDVTTFSQLNEKSYRNAPPNSFVNSVLNVLDVNKVDQKVVDQVMNLVLTTLPETSFARALQRRKGTLGFTMDAVGALQTKAYGIARQVTNIEYAKQFSALESDIRDDFATSKDQDTAKKYVEELIERTRFAMSPELPQWSKLARSFGFNMTLGFNVSSAVVNASQIPLVVMPYLGGTYGYKNTTREIGRATRAFMNSGVERMIEVLGAKGEKVKVRAMPSIDNIDFSDKKLNPELKKLETLVEVGTRLGQFNRSLTYDILDVSNKESFLTKVNALSGWAFHHGERMNRQVTLVAAYNLELDRLNSSKATAEEKKLSQKEKEVKAAEQAIYLAELTNGGISAASAPRLAQNALGSVAFMYKRYGVSMYYMLFKTTRDALSAQDPEVRKAAKRQIAGIYASSALLAGVQGVPLFGVVAMIADMFKEDDEDDFETSVRKYLGEGIYSGAMNALTGYEFAGRIGLSDLLFRDQNTNKDLTFTQSLLETLGGPVIGVANRIDRGLGLISEGYTARGIEQILPSAFSSLAKAERFLTEGAQTLRGDPITSEIGLWNVIGQVFGFAPAEYIRQLEENAALKKIDRSTGEERTKLLRRLYISLRMGDRAGMTDFFKDINDFNRRHPTAAILPDTIKNSLAQHMRTTAGMYHGISISKNMMPELLANAAEYDDGLNLWDDEA